MRHLRYVIWVCIFIGWIAGLRPAAGQSVRSEQSATYSRLLGRYLRAAEAQGRKDWPDVRYTQRGTQIWLTFDPHNADIGLLTNKAFGSEQLLRESRRIAIALDLPKADFIRAEGRLTTWVDLEFNDYLKRKPFRTDFDLELSTFALALRRSALPKPIVIALDRRKATAASLSPASSLSLHK